VPDMTSHRDARAEVATPGPAHLLICSQLVNAKLPVVRGQSDGECRGQFGPLDQGVTPAEGGEEPHLAGFKMDT